MPFRRFMHMNDTHITATHCTLCGSTDPEDVGHAALRNNDGYSDCCNELVSYGECDHHCSHHDDDVDVDDVPAPAPVRRPQPSPAVAARSDRALARRRLNATRSQRLADVVARQQGRR